MKLHALLVGLCLLAACGNKKPSTPAVKDTAVTSAVTSPKKNNVHLYTDTLQYLHFEGNFDYWYAVFIDPHRDTVQLVVDDQVPAKFRNKLVEVKWFTDTLFEAGDNDAKYPGKRLKILRAVGGNLFAKPVTEQTVINDIKNLPEVKANADQTGIAERPTDDKEYYLVETGTHDEDKFSRLFMFRVYVYPKYEIKFYDAATDMEMSLAEWRKKQQ